MTKYIVYFRHYEIEFFSIYDAVCHAKNLSRMFDCPIKVIEYSTLNKVKIEYSISVSVD